MFATFGFNNNDLLEETLSGKGTTHATNEAHNEIQGQKNSKKRSFKSVSIQIINYPGGKKVGPVPVQLPKEQLVRTIDTLKLSKRTDSIWLIISRLTSAHSLHPTSADPHCQTVPSWTAFSAKLNKENIPLPSNVGYCQAIDASATEMSTIYTALCKSIRMGEQLGQEDIVIVFDLAIYAKAAEIIWKRQVLIWKQSCDQNGCFSYNLHLDCSYWKKIW